MILTNQSTKSLKDQHAIAVQITDDKITPIYVDIFDILDIYLRKNDGDETDITGSDGTVKSYTDRFERMAINDQVVFQDKNVSIADNDSPTAIERKYDSDMTTYCSKANKDYSELGQYESDPINWSQAINKFDYTDFVDNPDSLSTIFNSKFSNILSSHKPRSSEDLNSDLNTYMKQFLNSIGIQAASSDDSLILTVDEVQSGSNKISANVWYKTTS